MNASFERLRVAGLCACMVLFFARVVAQIEVALLQPDWLPPMHAWYSGLIPYPALLPAQILVLLLMALVVYDHARGFGVFWPVRRGTRVALAWIAALYGAAMAVRLVVSAAITEGGLIEAGLIPVAFHWVLAAFLALISAAPASSSARSAPAHAKTLRSEKPLPRLPFLSEIAGASQARVSPHATGATAGEERVRPKSDRHVDEYSEVPLEDLVRIRRRSL